MEQFDRAQRYLNKIRNIYSGVFSSYSHDKDGYDDDVISFFIHCHHIRDWIIQLNKVGVTPKQVESYVNEHLALKICADLANGSKHCRLTKNIRTNRQPHIAGKEYRSSTWYTTNGGGVYLKSKYTIIAGIETHDALELAEECIQLWSKYIEKMKSDYHSI